jgi:hypothetical protein
VGDKHAERRAYIGRGAGDDFFGYVTDIATEQEVYEEGEWSDVETALAWARERADEVALTYGGSSDAVFLLVSPITEEQVMFRWPAGLLMMRLERRSTMRLSANATIRQRRAPAN